MVDAANVFSNDSLRMIGFNPMTGKEYVFRPEEEAEVENDLIKKDVPVASAAEKGGEEMIYFSDSE
jgi:hypothetical protein